jgi:hypothetical protein
MRYSWLLSNGRNKQTGVPQQEPGCSSASCVVTPTTGGDGTSFANAFSHDDAAASAGAVVGNSATFLANKYYGTGGVWPSTTKDQLQCSYRDWWGLGSWSPWADTNASSCPESETSFRTYRSQTVQRTTNADPAALPTVLDPSTSSVDTVLQDKTGAVVQFVVLEWWGSATTTTNGTMPADLEVEVFVN